MLLDWDEEVSSEDGVAVEEVTTGARSDEMIEGVSTELVVGSCAGVLEVSLVEASGACEDWTGVALISSFCWTATDGSEGGTSAVVVKVAAVGVAMASVLDEEHSEGTSLGFSHFKLPSSIPLQTSFWPTILPLRIKATTVGPGRSTVLKTSTTERLTA